MDKLAYTLKNDSQTVRDTSSSVEGILITLGELSPEETNYVLIRVIETITKDRVSRIDELRIMQSALERVNQELIDVIRENLK
jgi:hypothetical protein